MNRQKNNSPPQEDEVTTATRIVLRRLAIRSHAMQELRTILREKGISENTIDLVIEKYTQQGYCDDKQWVTDFVRTHQARKVGPRTILNKLKAKAISDELIESASEQLQDGTVHQESLQKLLTTRYRTRNLADFKERQKVIAALMRRGFTFDAIKAAIGMQQEMSFEEN